jgi:6-phosphogluconate dehydrogenase
MSHVKADIGLVGLGVMGQNLSLNMADHGYVVSVFDRHPDKTVDFISKCQNEEPSGDKLVGHSDVIDFVHSIKRPRKIVLLVKAGDATDATINNLLPHVEAGDIIIDGGNSHWLDTIRREKLLRSQGVELIGSGVSGGETGARFGPSLMPSGTSESWKHLEPIWRDIAAKVDSTTGSPVHEGKAGHPVKEGLPCTAYIGTNGAGHYVKMVHNGIEYIDMQLICEAYSLMKELLGMHADEIGKVFQAWNEGELSSYLIQITGDILQQHDPDGEGFLVDKILDAAGQKGTGLWTATNALNLGVPANAIAEAVFARSLSALKEERVEASKLLNGPIKNLQLDRDTIIKAIRDALYCSKICAYAQGFQLMTQAQKEYEWTLDFSTIAQIWQGGCIIRASFLKKISEAYVRQPNLKNLMLDDYFKNELHQSQEQWREVVALAVRNGVPLPAFSSALAYFDGYRSAALPANLLQAQRDYFGAHQYERTDQPRGKYYHLDWSNAERIQQEI